MTAALHATAISKTFPGTRALVDVSLKLEPGSVHALAGGNGSGKSTLIKLLAGVHAGDPGGRLRAGGLEVASDAVTPEWSRRAGIRFVHQDLGLFEELTVAENLAVDGAYPFRRGRIRWRELRYFAEQELDRRQLAVDVTAPVSSLRPSERTLVAIARALHGVHDRRDGVLVLDEPTARLPASEVDDLLAALRREAQAGHAIVYVSHRADEVLALADAVTVLRDGELVAAGVPASSLDEQRLARLVVGQELTSVCQTATTVAGGTALELRDVHAGPLHGVSATFAGGDIVGLTGLVGAGRTTLLETIFGVRRPRAGAVLVDGRQLPLGDVAATMARGVAYVPEERLAQAAFPDLSVTVNLSAADPRRFWRPPLLRKAAERAAAHETMRQGAIRGPSVDAPLHRLSGGNQQKVVLARWLRRAPRVLLLDEPTQGVDVGARADLHRRIRAVAGEGACVVVASSDLDELLVLADRLVALRGGALEEVGRRGDVDREALLLAMYGVGAQRGAA